MRSNRPASMETVQPQSEGLNMRKLIVILALLISFSSVPISTNVCAQSGIDRDLLSEISRIQAIDNHAHPLKYVAPGEKPDDEYDALPLEAIPSFPLPVRLRPTNLEFVRAWKDLYHYSHDDMSEAHVRELMSAKQKVLQERGESFPNWVLAQLNIETMFANRVAMGKGLAAPRFRWVSFIDALIFPLSNEAAKRSNPDYGGLYPAEEKLLKRYLADLKLTALPTSLDAYLKIVVTPTLESQKRNGAVAIKYEAAYLRKLDFDDPDGARARATYDRFFRGGEPPARDYKALQDFLFFYIAQEAGRLGLAVHIHCFEGAGGFYSQTGSNPLLLERAFNDPALRKTNFVVVHGAYPFTREMRAMLVKPNVYADFSAQTFFLYPRELSTVLRSWLEIYPDKVLFGTDAFSFGPELDWGELAWFSNSTARQALALALTGMMNDGEIDRARANELARM